MINLINLFNDLDSLLTRPFHYLLCDFLRRNIFRLVLLVLVLLTLRWYICHLSCNCSNLGCWNLLGILLYPSTWGECQNQRIFIKLIIGEIFIQFGYFTYCNLLFTLIYWVFCSLCNSQIRLAFLLTFYFFEWKISYQSMYLILTRHFFIFVTHLVKNMVSE